MQTIKEKLENVILNCVEHHGYQDEDEVPVHLTIKEVRQLLKLLKKRICMCDELDTELDTIIREAYNKANKDYLRKQSIIALVASSKSREEAEQWINQRMNTI